MLKDSLNYTAEVKKILAPTKYAFDGEKIDSVLSMLNKAAQIDGNFSTAQKAFVAEVDNQFQNKKSESKW